MSADAGRASRWFSIAFGRARLHATFDCMKARTILLACPAALLPFTGCVLLPHTSLVAPPASGQVLDKQTLKPIGHASVVRRIEGADKTFKTITDEGGSFQIAKSSQLVWLGGCRAANSIDYVVLAEGYRPFQTNMYGGGDFYRGTVPHDLGRILLPRIPQ